MNTAEQDAIDYRAACICHRSSVIRLLEAFEQHAVAVVQFNEASARLAKALGSLVIPMSFTAFQMPEDLEQQAEQFRDEDSE